MQVFLSQLMLGLVNGSFYAMLSLGLAVIFGLLGIVNFAHGALYMLGAYLSYTIASWFVGSPAAFWAARVAGDPKAQWELLEPRGRGRMTPLEYVPGPGAMKYLAYQVETAAAAAAGGPAQRA